MAGHATLRAELQEQRRLIEQLRVEIQRQRRQAELQFRRTADLQAELDDIKGISLRGLPTQRPTQVRRSDRSAAWTR